MKRAVLLACATLGLVAPLWAAELRVRSAGPEGELASLDQANEVRVVFAEPMVALGRIPDPVTAPFFTIAPAVKGSFRWAGTDTLIFKPRAPLPFATTYTVTIATSATSVAGNSLKEPHTFSFTTPTVKLLRTSWYRKTRMFDSPAVIVLRFNQPVAPLEISKHLSLRYEPHPWNAPTLPEPARARALALDPQAVTDFEAKVAATRAATRSRAIVPYFNATTWDQKAFPPSPDLVVLETKEVPPTDAWIHVWLDGKVPAAGGNASGGEEQKYTVKLEPTLFVDGTSCSAACDPESYNPLRLRASVVSAQVRKALSVWDVTDSAEEKALKPKKPQQAEEGEEDDTPPEVYDVQEYEYDHSSSIDLEYAGFPLKPARTYALAVARTLKARDGQMLGYTWAGTLENWRQNAFSSFGDGHGVWESTGGTILPYHARNLQSVAQWADPLKVDDLMPAVKRLQDDQGARSKEPAPPHATTRTLRPKPDALQSYGLEMKPMLSAGGTGLVWAGLVDGTPIAKSRFADTSRRHDTIVQVTNLGISVKDSPVNTLVLVTRLSDGQPVEGATVSIRNLDNAVAWSGPTDARGLAEAPNVDLRDHEAWWRFRFLVTAEKDGDVAYVGSDWNEGIEPWSFDGNFDLNEAGGLLRGSIFADRGVYKLGEEVHFKAVLRSDTAKGILLLPPGTAVEVKVVDSQGGEKDKRTLTLSEWSSGEWTFTLPADGPLGRYEVSAKIESQRNAVSSGFLVAAYRRPEFRVDANLAGESSLAGVGLKGVVNGRYLFGAPMGGRDVTLDLHAPAPADGPAEGDRHASRPTGSRS